MGSDTLDGYDTLFAADKLLGNSGGDVLRGGKGKDRLWGDSGADTLVWTDWQATDKADIVEDGDRYQYDAIDVTAVDLTGTDHSGTLGSTT